MASEAEIERLYQLFVANGGGAGTFDNTNLTPKQYSDSVNASKLSPLELAQLESKQHQYNKQSALRSIADEIDANNFTNPYATRGAYSSSLFTGLGASLGVSKIGDISSALSGLGTGDKALLFAGVMAASGVDLEQILKIGGLALLGTTMFSSLTNHTNNQTANIPQTMADASSLASMNSQFGEAGDPCSFFNQLMGLLGGLFDGTLDFIDGAVTGIHGFLKQTGLLDLLSSILSAITGAVGGVAGIIAAIVGALVGVGVAIIKTLGPLVGKIINAIAAIVSQIATELAGFADMAAALLRKALALVLGSAALDPCQSAVLMNTGTIAMKDAVTLLKHPMGTGAPGGIGTTVDDKANPERVKKVMSDAQKKADLAQGVIQNPLTEGAKTYTTKDETLHSALVVDGVLPTIPTGSTYKEMQVHAYQHWITVKNEWDYNQRDYMYKAKAHEKIMATAYKTRDFSNKSALKTRLGVLVQENWVHQDNVSALLENISLSFFYFVPGGKKDESIEASIKTRYDTYLKPAMTRIYNDALAFQKSSKIEWDSIDSQTF
mgnify:CR=1 FL=1